MFNNQFKYAQNTLKAALTGITLVTIAACGNDDPVLPQLAAATPAAFTGDCTTLAAKVAGFANTSITATTTVAAGVLKIAGQDIAEHCLVTGKMFQRTSPVDGASYAIGFEMRLPKAWNGRFLHQGNGGIDGSVATAAGAFGGGPLH